MIEERGHVLSVEDGAVWVETIRRSTCGSCSARAGCGQAILQKLGSGARQGFVRVLSDSGHRVGDQVVIGVPENAVVRSSLLVYAVPLVGLFAFALAAQMLFGLEEPGIILSAFFGLAAGFGAVRLHEAAGRNNPSLQPRVIQPIQQTVAHDHLG